MNLEEFYKWYDKLSQMPIDTNILVEMEKFYRFSPQKFAKINNIDEVSFIKEVNGFKKIIHNKILCSNRINKLKKYTPDLKPIRFHFNGPEYKPRVCICRKFFLSSGKHQKFRFYETIKYHYVVNEFDRTIIVFNEKNIGIHISYSEFDEYFDDIRDFLIDEILG